MMGLLFCVTVKKKSLYFPAINLFIYSQGYPGRLIFGYARQVYKKGQPTFGSSLSI